MKIVAIVQARMGSNRLPGKVMKMLNGKPMIEYQLKRLAKTKSISKIVVATSINLENDVLSEHVSSLGFDVFRGSEDNVLDRFYVTAKKYAADVILRITADCPLIDYGIIDQMIEIFLSNDIDYLTNAFPPSFPDGLDTEIFTFDALQRTALSAQKVLEKEHVTPYMRESGEFKIMNFSSVTDFSEMRWTVDESADFEVIKGIFDYFAPRVDFRWMEIVELYKLKPELFEQNSAIARNEGYFESKIDEIEPRVLLNLDIPFFHQGTPLETIIDRTNEFFEEIAIQDIYLKSQILDLRHTSNTLEISRENSLARVNDSKKTFTNSQTFGEQVRDYCSRLLHESNLEAFINVVLSEEYLTFNNIDSNSYDEQYAKLKFYRDFASFGILFQGEINLKLISDKDMYYFLKVLSLITALSNQDF